MRRLTPLALAAALILPHCTNAPRPQPQAAPQQSAAVQSPLAEKVPLDPDVRRGVLPNGLTYYIRVNHRPEKRAELRLAVNAGSILESEEQRGLAHFVEHMAFNGTASFPKQELTRYLERIGMRFGPDVNAYTSFDETVYMLQVPTDDPKIVQTAFHILHDWAGSVSFEKSEVDRERGVLVEEWRLGRGAGARIRDKQFPVVFHGSQYAERLPIGKPEILQKASAEQVRDFYRTWYRPDLMAVVAVGDFDPAAVETLIREQFGAIPAARKPAPRKTFPIPDHKETLTSVVTDPEMTAITVEVDYKRPPIAHGTVGQLRDRLVDSLYDSMMMARLAELGRAADPPYTMAFAASGGLARTKSAYRIYARVNNGGVERALSTLLTEAQRVEKYGFSESELERAKTSFLRSIDRAYDDRDKQESSRLVGSYVSNFLEQWPAPGIAYTHDADHKLIPGITLAEVNARASQWITDTNRVILVSGPEKKEAKIPDEAKVLAVFNDTQKVAVTPWVDRVRNEPLVATQPKPGTIVDEKTFPEVGVTRWKLSNGAVVLLKQTDFKNEEILIQGWSPGGTSLAPDSIHHSAQYSSSIVMQGGVGNFDATELQKALTGKQAYISPWIGELNEGIRGMAAPRDLETAMQLLYLDFTAPRRDEKAFTSYVTKLRGQLENQEAAPGYWFERKMNEVMWQNHPRRRMLTTADVDQLNLDQAMAFYKERFADASDFTFTIVGNVDAATLRPLVEKWIASLPTIGRTETWRNLGIRPPAGIEKVKVEKGIEPRSSVRIVFNGDAVWSLDNAHQISSLADVLRIRLREELREDRGGVYGVGVFGGITRYPEQRYTMTISFATDPKRVDELVKAVFDEIAKLKTDGPADDYINRVHEAQRRSHETALKENGFWVSQIEYLATNDLNFGEIAKYDQRVAAVTRDSIRDAARKYLDDKRYVIGVLDPEKTEKAAK